MKSEFSPAARNACAASSGRRCRQGPRVPVRELGAMRSHHYVIALLAVCCSFSIARAAGQADTGDVIHVDIATPLRTLQPMQAVGSTVDKEPAGTIPSLYSKRNIRAMLDAGLGWLSYRLFTELSDQDWHWNPAGTFSAGHEGYWTSSASTSSPPIADSFGYRLPHTGNTSDQGNNEGYSRLVDGDPRTYWKSDPYLTSAFTGDPDDTHPQWAVIDLGATRIVNAVSITWAVPYATQYAVQYWNGDDAIGNPAVGAWVTFPTGAVMHAKGGRADLHFPGPPAQAQFVRVVMTRSSNTCDSHGSADRRNCVGYAINEIAVGSFDRLGKFHDFVHHARCGGEKPGTYGCGERQTATYVSSVDPWHRAEDRVRNQEQPGLDLIARSGLTRGIAAMYPVPMLYSTPENAVAEVRFLKARGYPIYYIELGEEPDGQFITPEDDAALYVQWARALHRLDPNLKLGGPVFSGVNSDVPAWPDVQDNVSWLNRFLRYLNSHDRMSDLAFMSFEHYPFNGCEHGAALLQDLLQEPSIMKGIVNTWHSDGLPSSLPLFITEGGFSAVNASQTSMQIEGGLWLADYLAGSLSHGVDGIVYYQYEPVPLLHNRGCPQDWGNLSMFVADTRANIRARGAQFFAAQMVTQQWLAPGNGRHELYAASCFQCSRASLLARYGPLITAYAVKRPDGTLSVMVVNKDTQPHNVAVEFAGSDGAASGFSGDVGVVSFGSAQYVWQARGAQSRPFPNDPPAVSTTHGGEGVRYPIPAQSITVLRGQTAPPKG